MGKLASVSKKIGNVSKKTFSKGKSLLGLGNYSNLAIILAIVLIVIIGFILYTYFRKPENFSSSVYEDYDNYEGFENEDDYEGYDNYEGYENEDDYEGYDNYEGYANECKDLNPKCDKWAKSGLCDDKSMKKQMDYYCKKSCNLCPAEEKKDFDLSQCPKCPPKEECPLPKACPPKEECPKPKACPRCPKCPRCAAQKPCPKCPTQEEPRRRIVPIPAPSFGKAVASSKQVMAASKPVGGAAQASKPTTPTMPASKPASMPASMQASKPTTPASKPVSMQASKPAMSKTTTGSKPTMPASKPVMTMSKPAMSKTTTVSKPAMSKTTATASKTTASKTVGSKPSFDPKTFTKPKNKK